MTKRNECIECEEYVPILRWRLGYRTCLQCGEVQAKIKATRHTVVPMAKSNYILVTDRNLLKELNKYANT